MKNALLHFLTLCMAMNALAANYTPYQHPEYDPLLHSKLALLESTKLVSAISSGPYYRPQMLEKVLQRSEELRDEYLKLKRPDFAKELERSLINPLTEVVGATRTLQKCHEQDESYGGNYQRTLLSGLNQKQDCMVENGEYMRALNSWAREVQSVIGASFTSKALESKDYARVKELLYRKQREMIIGNSLMAERMYFDEEELDERAFSKKLKKYSAVQVDGEHNKIIFERLKNIKLPSKKEREASFDKLAGKATSRTNKLYEEYLDFNRAVKNYQNTEAFFDKSGEKVFLREYKPRPNLVREYMPPVPHNNVYELMTRFQKMNDPRIGDPFFAQSPIDVSLDTQLHETIESSTRVDDQIVYYAKKLNELKKTGAITENVVLFDDVNSGNFRLFDGQQKLDQKFEGKGLFGQLREMDQKQNKVDLRFLGPKEFAQARERVTNVTEFERRYGEVQKGIVPKNASNDQYTYNVPILKRGDFEEFESHYDLILGYKLKDLAEKNKGVLKLSQLQTIHKEAMAFSRVDELKKGIIKGINQTIKDKNNRLEFYREELRSGDLALVVQAEELASGIRFDGGIKTYTPSKVKDLLKKSLSNLKELMETVDEWYEDNDPKDFVEDSLYFNPALASALIQENPEEAVTLCKMYQEALINKKVSKEDREKWHRRLMWTAGIAFVAAVVMLTAGVALPFVAGGAGVLTTIGTVSTGVGGLALKVGMAASALQIGLTAYDGYQLSKEARITKEHIEALGIGDEYEAQDLMKDAMEKYVESSLWGTVTLLTSGGPKMVMNSLRHVNTAGGLKAVIQGSAKDFGTHAKNFYKMRRMYFQDSASKLKGVVITAKAGKLSDDVLRTIDEAGEKLFEDLVHIKRIPESEAKKIVEVFHKKLIESPIEKFALSSDEIANLISKINPSRLTDAASLNETLEIFSLALKKGKDAGKLERVIELINNDPLWKRLSAYQSYLGEKYPHIYSYLFDDLINTSDDLVKGVHKKLGEFSDGVRKEVIQHRESISNLGRYEKNLEKVLDDLAQRPDELKLVLTQSVDDYILLANTSDAKAFKQPLQALLTQIDEAQSPEAILKLFADKGLKGKTNKDLLKNIYNVKDEAYSVTSMQIPARLKLMKDKFFENNKLLMEDAAKAAKQSCGGFKGPKQIWNCVSKSVSPFYNRFLANHPCLRNNSQWAFWSFFSAGWAGVMDTNAHRSKIQQDPRYKLLGQLIELDLSPESSLVDREYFSLLREMLATDTASMEEVKSLLSAREMGNAIQINKLKSKEEIYTKASDYIAKEYGVKEGSTSKEFPLERFIYVGLWSRYWAEMSCRINYGNQVNIGNNFNPALVAKNSKTFWASGKEYIADKFKPILIPSIISSGSYAMIRASLIKYQEREVQVDLKDTVVDTGVFIGRELTWESFKWLSMSKINGIVIPKFALDTAKNMKTSPAIESKFASVLTFNIQFAVDKVGLGNYNAWEYKYFSENLLGEMRSAILGSEKKLDPSESEVLHALIAWAYIKDGAGSEVPAEDHELVKRVQRSLLVYGLELEDFYLENNEEGHIIIGLGHERVMELIKEREERLAFQ